MSYIKKKIHHCPSLYIFINTYPSLYLFHYINHYHIYYIHLCLTLSLFIAVWVWCFFARPKIMGGTVSKNGIRLMGHWEIDANDSKSAMAIHVKGKRVEDILVGGLSHYLWGHHWKSMEIWDHIWQKAIENKHSHWKCPFIVDLLIMVNTGIYMYIYNYVYEWDRLGYISIYIYIQSGWWLSHLLLVGNILLIYG